MIGRKPSTTIKSVRGPNGRNDPVVHILNVDPAYYHDDDTDDGMKSTANGGGGDSTTNTNTTNITSDYRTLVMRSRIITVCGSGVAFLWDVRVSIDRSTGSLRDLTVLPVSVLICFCFVCPTDDAGLSLPHVPPGTHSHKSL
jgi:hypothetical protein